MYFQGERKSERGKTAKNAPKSTSKLFYHKNIYWKLRIEQKGQSVRDKERDRCYTLNQLKFISKVFVLPKTADRSKNTRKFPRGESHLKWKIYLKFILITIQINVFGKQFYFQIKEIYLSGGVYISSMLFVVIVFVVALLSIYAKVIRVCVRYTVPIMRCTCHEKIYRKNLLLQRARN